MNFLISIGILIFFSSVIYAESNILQTNTEFYYPGNMKHKDSRYLGFGDQNKNYGYKCHLANDYSLPAGSPIYAVGNGIVKKASLSVGNYGGDGTTKAVGGAIVIEHKTSNGIIFYALYGHLKHLKYGVGDFVEAGNHIGDVGTYYSDGTPLPHLHFGINTSIPTYTGYTPTSECKNFKGYVNPELFLETNSPSSTSSSKSSVFDGAGSLIDPGTQCSGCDNDIALMHPHAPLKSTVVFQWYYNDLSCQFLNLTTDSNKKLPVSIHLKQWDDHKIKTAYKTTLYQNKPISIASEGKWTTFAVTSQQPIKDSIRIIAKCGIPNDTGYTPPQDREDIPLNLVDVGLGNYWTGTGSIISQARAGKGFGVNKDYAITFSQHKSLTSFQWYSSSICKSITVRDIDIPAKKIKASVAIKIWNSKTFDNVCDSLPCTFNEKPQGWYVIKIKTAKGAVSSGGLETICN